MSLETIHQVTQARQEDHSVQDSQFSSVAPTSVQSCPALCDPMDCSTPGLPVHHQLLEFTQTHVHRVSDAIQPTSSSSFVPCSSRLQSFPASGSFPMSQFFTTGGQSIGASALASVLPISEYSGLISFRMDWLDLLVIQGTLKSLLQYHSSKALILWRSAFFIVQLLHPYMTTGKSIALTVWTLVGRVMSLCFLICCLGWS